MFYHLGLLLIIKYTSAFEEFNPVVFTSSGKVQGMPGKTVNRYVGYYSFKGIPFAQKPIGKLRFEPPVKNHPWKGVLNASQDKDECTQFNNEGTAILGSEDCLYLSVYTTSNLTGFIKLLPVMIYISGGAFQRGSSKYGDYPPDYFLEKEVIYVGINYRLGIFGFLCTEDMVVPGNAGLKDQILAIQWVRENIKGFGGDPDRITVFGQSAGAVSVSYLLQSHLTKGFFKQAIMQSGTSLCVWALNLSPREQAFKVGQLLQINATDTKTLVENLRKVEYVALKAAEFQITNRETVKHFIRGLPFGVAQEPDHPGAVFSIKSKSHLQLIKEDFPKIPILLGFTTNEAALYTNEIQFLNSTLVSYDVDVSKLAPTGIVRDSIKRELAGRKIKNQYFGNNSIVIQPTKFIEFFTIDGFKRPIRESARLFSNAKNSKIFFYQFGFIGNLGTSNRNYKGVAHGEDVKYLFVKKNANATSKDMETVERMIALWTNFAKTGNPTPPNTQDKYLGGIIWHPNTSKQQGHNNYFQSDNIWYLNINDTLRMESKPFQLDWIFYQNIARQFGDPPFTTFLEIPVSIVFKIIFFI